MHFNSMVNEVTDESVCDYVDGEIMDFYNSYLVDNTLDKDELSSSDCFKIDNTALNFIIARETVRQRMILENSMNRMLETLDQIKDKLVSSNESIHSESDDGLFD